MNDSYGRKIQYLRLSVTDLCNYRCIYCIAETGVHKKDHSEILSIEEMTEIAPNSSAPNMIPLGFHWPSETIDSARKP